MKRLSLLVLFLASLFCATPASSQIAVPPVPDASAAVTVAFGTRPANDQKIETTWRSEDGAQHTVRTTIPGDATEDVMRDRVERHTRMVTLLQAVYAPVAAFLPRDANRSGLRPAAEVVWREADFLSGEERLPSALVAGVRVLEQGPRRAGRLPVAA